MENINEKIDSTLTDKERDGILSDLFEGKEGTLDSSFLYKGKGAELYEAISKDKSYPFIDIEVSCLEKLKHDEMFKKVLDKTNYITDVGSGDGQKAVALLGGTGWQGTYIAEDYSWQMLNIAEEKITSSAPQIKLGSSQKLNTQGHLSRQCANNMYLFLGGTICNMTDDEIIKELRNMDNNGFLDGNHILLSYFTAPQTQEEIDNLIKIYNSESNRAFHENGMDMLGLSRDDFEFDTVYEKDNPNQTKGPFPGKIKGIIRAKRDCTVKLSSGKIISLKQGQEFTIHYSRRFSKSGIEELLKKSGCNTVFTVDKNGDSIVLLKRKPTKIKKFINNHKKAILVALTLGSMATGAVSGNILSEKKQKESDKEKALTERISSRLSSKDISSIEGTYYGQETDELIIALQLDELNKNDRKVIIELFNVYVSHHKDEGLTNAELIQGFWVKYGMILINHHNLRHSPYDFMDHKLIENTNNIDEEVSCKLAKSSSNKYHTYNPYGTIIYNGQDNGIVNFSELNGTDIKSHGIFINGELYHVIKVPTKDGKLIGLASKTPDGQFTTTEFNNIAKIFSNNRNMGYINAR